MFKNFKWIQNSSHLLSVLAKNTFLIELFSSFELQKHPKLRALLVIPWSRPENKEIFIIFTNEWQVNQNKSKPDASFYFKSEKANNKVFYLQLVTVYRNDPLYISHIILNFRYPSHVFIIKRGDKSSTQIPYYSFASWQIVKDCTKCKSLNLFELKRVWLKK